jgi:nicotinamidase-related amidase
MQNALIVIDMQESFRVRPLWGTLHNPALLDNVRRLVDAARRRGDEVVWVLHAEEGSGDEFDPANGHVRLMDEFASDKDEPIIVKSSHNAFSTTNLQQHLTMRGVGSVTVCGIRTEQCVETTARVASDFGYAVTFVTDATGSFPIPHWDAPDDPAAVPAGAAARAGRIPDRPRCHGRVGGPRGRLHRRPHAAQAARATGTGLGWPGHEQRLISCGRCAPRSQS